MTTLNFLYICLAIAALGTMGAVWFIALRVGKTLQELHPIIRDMKNISHDVKQLETSVKENVVVRAVSFLSSLFVRAV